MSEITMRRTACFICLILFAVASGGLFGEGQSPCQADAQQTDVEAKLRAKSPDVRFENMTLENAIDALRKQSGANIVFRWKSPSDKKCLVSLQVQGVTFGQALKLTLLAAQTAEKYRFTLNDNVIVIGPPDWITAQALVRVYDISDLILGEQERQRRLNVAAENDSNPRNRPSLLTSDAIVERIITTLQETIDPESWREAGGSFGSIRELSGRLVIQQSWDAQERIAAFLDGLRRTPMPAPTQPAATLPASR